MAKKSAPKKSKSSDDDSAPVEELEEFEDGEEVSTEPQEVPDEEPPPAKDEPPTEASAPPADTSTITIDGDEGGTVPLYVDGAMTRLDRGVAIEVTGAQIAALKQVGVKFKEAKSSGKK